MAARPGAVGARSSTAEVEGQPSYLAPDRSREMRRALHGEKAKLAAMKFLPVRCRSRFAQPRVLAHQLWAPHSRSRQDSSLLVFTYVVGNIGNSSLDEDKTVFNEFVPIEACLKSSGAGFSSP